MNVEETATILPGNEVIQESIEEIWYLKEISFRPTPTAEPRKYKIITQNFNGPCSFIAICNILILRDKIHIEPPHREAITYDYLSQLLAEYLLLSCPDVDISAALSILPATRKGLDLNPLFTGCEAFRPATTGGELELFTQAGIQLVHGWLVDPSSPEHRVLVRTEDYDSSVNLLVEADHLTKGHFMVADASPSAASASQPAFGAHLAHATYNLSPEEQQKVEDALLVRHFLDNARSQLTYHGLFTLATALEPHALVALFRSSHLAVLYKAPAGDAHGGGLYTLVTDQVFLHEPSVVWERLEDVDGGWSTFVDSDFVRAAPAGGDYAGHTAESALAALEDGVGALTLAGQADEHLAQQLQAEEYERSNRIAAAREQARANREREAEEAERRERERRERKKKKDCIVM
ncbi:uncharacterized protein BXZ73DRAFT_52668 [Epithele typhae]|uniref:uncharacterized protein n=1 Tax=Epithele typhae TaxID=378194 RepID=UPI002007BD58|nr:uncharacterized protein BXZ73DRAFT_52668 [Epithele typhae]KAH9918906.1 hypothetical protein BXZ73DRAFT_52668 [Epithele typhae]